MDYHIQRGDQKFGPYSLTELQEYFQSGRVLPGDLAQSEGMADWVPVSQILGNIPIPQISAPVSAPPAVETVPLPPNLHWSVLLIVLILGRVLGFLILVFSWAWAMVLANWARKLINDNKPMVLVAMYPAGFIAGVIAVAVGGSADTGGFAALGLLFFLGGFAIYVYGIFKIRDAMEEYYNSRENIGLTLSGVMTFFFSIVYLQYHVNRIHKWKKTGVLA